MIPTLRPRPSKPNTPQAKMAGTKRMSQEEKRKTILSIYHKSKQ